MPGSTGGTLLSRHSKQHSGKKCGRDFGLCYNPEFIALGSVIRDMLNPDMILIGESDPRSGELLEELYKGVCDSNPRIQRMNYVNAELTKLSVNTFVTTKISYANMLAQVCERLPGADADVVTSAIGCDTRIGSKYLKGALGYGGPCFPRDNVAFSALARATGAPALLAEATDQLNRRQVPLADRDRPIAAAERRNGGRPGTLLQTGHRGYRGIPGSGSARSLLAAGVKVVVYDPAAMENAKRSSVAPLRMPRSAPECARQADVLVITTPWPEFKKLTPGGLKSGERRPAIIDCWRVLPADLFANLTDYLRLDTEAWLPVPRIRPRMRVSGSTHLT